MRNIFKKTKSKAEKEVVTGVEVKQEVEQEVTGTNENPIVQTEPTCTSNECFLKTINHPRKLELATGLLNGENPESFYADYGNIRVMEMMKMINSYNADPEKYLKSHQIIGCKNCGR